MKILSTTVFLLSLLFCGSPLAAPAMFGKKEVSYTDIEGFPKWMNVLDKKKSEFGKYDKRCIKDSKKFYCNIKEWLDYTASLLDMDKKQQLDSINNFANEKKYILDETNWGKTDYWASPGEFLFKNGDCEDYAIIKYMSLKQLGFDTKDLRIVVLMDNNLKVYHSVLAVYLDDKIYILDNQLTTVTNSKNIFHYEPVYSINEKNWWKHI